MPTTVKAVARAIAVVAAIFLALSLVASAGVARKEIDYDALESAWEADDAAQELLSEGDEQFRHLSKSSQVDAKALGPQMIFVTLDDTVEETLGELASRWKEMLWLGGVDVSVYELGASKLLVGLQKGMFVDDLRRFLAKQTHVKEYEWKGETYATSSEPKARKQQRKATKKQTAAKTAKQHGHSFHKQTEL